MRESEITLVECQKKQVQDHEKNALYETRRGQKTPLRGMRTVSTAPVPQVPSPTVVALLWSPSSCARLFWDEKREEKVKEQEEQKKEVDELCTPRASLAYFVATTGSREDKTRPNSSCAALQGKSGSSCGMSSR